MTGWFSAGVGKDPADGAEETELVLTRRGAGFEHSPAAFAWEAAKAAATNKKRKDLCIRNGLLV